MPFPKPLLEPGRVDKSDVFTPVFPEANMLAVSTERDFSRSGDGADTALRERTLPAFESDSLHHLALTRALKGSWYRPENEAELVISVFPDLVTWGTGELYFDSCNTGIFQFTSEIKGISGGIPLTRISGDDTCGRSSKSVALHEAVHAL